MKKIALFITLCFAFILTQAQDKRHMPVFWMGPSKNVQVHGVNVSPVMYCMPDNVLVNGINIDGLGLPFIELLKPHDPWDLTGGITVLDNYTVNGVSIGVGGLLQDGVVNGLAATPLMLLVHQVNGMYVAGLIAYTYNLNGVGIALLTNSTIEMNGVQIGFLNKANRGGGVQIGIINRGREFYGLQIGLWNRNHKGVRPLFNW